MDMQNFLWAAVAFAAGSFIGSVAFCQILPELQDIKKEKSFGSVLTCVAWLAAMGAGVIFAFKFDTVAGGFSIVGLAYGFLTSVKMTR